MKTKSIENIVLHAIALATGVAGVVLAFLGNSLQTSVILFGIGIFCLGLAGLEKS